MARVFGVWCVWCLVFGVWCLVFGVWCLVFGYCNGRCGGDVAFFVVKVEFYKYYVLAG